MLLHVFESVKVGDEVINLLKLPITKVQLVRYAGASGDVNLLHTDNEVARSAGFDGVVAHGMLVMGIVAQAVTEWLPKKSLRKLIFKGVTRPGDRLKVTGVLTEKRVANGKGIVKCSLEAKDENHDLTILGSFEALLSLQQ